MLSLSCIQHPSSTTTTITTTHHQQPPPQCFLSPLSLSSPFRRPKSLSIHYCCSSFDNDDSSSSPKHHNRPNYYYNPNNLNIAEVKLKIAIIGFGNFGQFLAKTIVKQGHIVLAYSRSDYSAIAKDIGVHFFSDPSDLCEEHPQVMLLCTSILSTEGVLRALPLHRLRRSTLFVDVLSVKEYPQFLLLQLLPTDFDILCTHPMFGPDSGKFGWAGLPFVFDKVRVGSDPARTYRVEAFLDIFGRAGCEMVEMSCAEHDRHVAGSQFITHMMGRVLENLGLEDTPIMTKGYRSLLSLVDNTTRDSFELFYGLFLYNKNAMEQLERIELAFDMVKQQLFEYLHDLVRKQFL